MSVRLTASDLDVIGRARELADAEDADGFRRVLSLRSDLEQSSVHATALGTAQHLLAELADMAERLGGAR